MRVGQREIKILIIYGLSDSIVQFGLTYGDISVDERYLLVKFCRQ